MDGLRAEISMLIFVIGIQIGCSIFGFATLFQKTSRVSSRLDWIEKKLFGHREQ
ncbi:MAG: hypothetical protein ACRD4Q_01160 [Candidatus Acidiferrales bacterium]